MHPDWSASSIPAGGRDLLHRLEQEYPIEVLAVAPEGVAWATAAFRG